MSYRLTFRHEAEIDLEKSAKWYELQKETLGFDFLDEVEKKCTEVSLIVELVDGHTISAPLIWFPRLAKAKKEQLENWVLLGDGEDIHWPDVDEDLSVNGLFVGTH